MTNISQPSNDFFNPVPDRKTPDGEGVRAASGKIRAELAPGADKTLAEGVRLDETRPRQLKKRVFERHHAVNHDAPALQPGRQTGLPGRNPSKPQPAKNGAAAVESKPKLQPNRESEPKLQPNRGSEPKLQRNRESEPKVERNLESEPKVQPNGPTLKRESRVRRDTGAAQPVAPAATQAPAKGVAPSTTAVADKAAVSAKAATEPDLITQAKAVHSNSKITDIEWSAGAEALHCSPAVLKALYASEARHKPFDEQGRPTVNFRRNEFSFLTHHRYDKDHPGVSGNPYVRNWRIGPDGDYVPREDAQGSPRQQYARLAQAAALDDAAALEASTWGACQLSGSRYLDCGCANVFDFVRAMCTSEASQLQLFVNYCGKRLDPAALRNKSWRSLAQSFKQGATDKQIDAYAKRLETTYRKFAA